MTDIAERREKERLKRLNRLGVESSSRTTLNESATREEAQPSDPKARTLSVERRKLSITPEISQESNSGPQKFGKPDKADSARPKETLSAWISSNISSILQVTFDPANEKFYYLSQLHDELNEEDALEETPSLTVDNLDRTILCRLADDMPSPPFDYLLECYVRAENTLRAIKKDGSDVADKNQVISEIKRLCVNYAGLSVTMPELLETMHAPADLIGRLLHPDQEDRGIPDTFLRDLVAKFTDEDSLADFFEPILLGISQNLQRLCLTDDFYQHFRAFRTLLQYPGVASVLYHSSHFSPDCSAAEIEVKSLLGPFFKISPISARVADLTFSSIPDGNQSQLSAGISSLRAVLPVLLNQLFDICNVLIRQSSESREALLKYFAYVLKLNKKRHAIQVDAATVSSDGFMVNITAVLNKFSEPFMSDSSKISKIDIGYLRRKPLVDLEGETRLMADENTTNEYYSHLVLGENNFISHVFFLNVAYHHYGLGATMSAHQKVLEKIRDMQKYRDRMQGEQPFTGPQAMMMTMQFQRIEKALAQARAISYCFEAQLCDEAIQARSFSFLSLVASWLIRLVDESHEYPQTTITLPLPSLDAAEAYKNLPEYFVEDIAEYFLYVSRMMPGLLSKSPITDLVVFSLTFLRSPEYIKNPYLKAKLVEILFNGVRPLRRGETQGALSPVLNTHTLALQHLFPALMGFYIEVESTGLSSQFYDKFNIRFHISQIFKSIWENPAHREKLSLEAKNDIEFFVKFVALLLNDQTYLLDEALAKLSEIHDLQIELGGIDDKTTEQYQEKQGHLQQAERQATSYLQLGTETLSLLNLFTASIPAAFCTAEIADRLAAMLDYNIDALVGPKCTGLKVHNPENYQFDPKALLSGIVGIFLNMSSYSDFIFAVVRDGRSYKKENFDRTAAIMRKFALRSSRDIELLQEFVSNVELKKIEYQQDEDDLGEIPDEFLDPLIGELMRDPVTLPTSRTIIDRATIKRHLLNDATDPFNRSPLELKDVIPATELKKQIEEFIQSKKRVKV